MQLWRRRRGRSQTRAAKTASPEVKIGTLAKTTQQKHKPQSLPCEPWQRDGCQEQEVEQCKQRWVLGKAPAGLTEQGPLTRMPQRATRRFCLIVGQPSLIPAETGGGGSKGRPRQNAQLSASWKSITTPLHSNHQVSLYRLS